MLPSVRRHGAPCSTAAVLTGDTTGFLAVGIGATLGCLRRRLAFSGAGRAAVNGRSQGGYRSPWPGLFAGRWGEQGVGSRDLPHPMREHGPKGEGREQACRARLRLPTETAGVPEDAP